MEYEWPGFIQLNDTVFIGETEISISNYGEALGLMKLLFGSYDRLEEAMPFPNSIHWMGYDPFRKLSFSVNQIFEIHKVTKS
ncbi:MAG TPA: hypothetical protein VEA37_10720, partial [Flavobacterium sp.]|nr:hypothetical protein [Flavobacterium sp.]